MGFMLVRKILVMGFDHVVQLVECNPRALHSTHLLNLKVSSKYISEIFMYMRTTSYEHEFNFVKAFFYTSL